MDRAVSPDASLFQSGAEQSREKKGEKKGIGWEGREEGFFAVSPCPQLFFSACFSLRRPHSVWRLEQAFLALADSALAVRKKDTKTMNVLINRETRDQEFFLE